MTMSPDFERVLISREEIAARVSELAKEIDRDYADKNPLFIAILKGSVFFCTDLLQSLTIPAEFDFMSVSSYGSGTTSTGRVRILKDHDIPIEDRHVVLVEDIVDSGNTLDYIRNLFLSRKCASVRICTLLSKPSRRKADVPVDYCGFTIPDEFVVGYGLDYAEKYRNLPDIGVLRPEVYEK